VKILLVADEESKSLWDYWDKSKIEGTDLIISCGDLKPEYLSFLVTMSGADVLYVHGNHDENYIQNQPEGCICIEDDIFVYKGVRILGLGGSMKYRNGKFMFTEKEMQSRINRLKFKLLRRKGFDILVTHAPAYNLNDMEDLPHRGFECFNTLISKYHPAFFVHGHIHSSYSSFRRITEVSGTTVVNAFEKYFIEYPDNQKRG